jgi:hypothetical protein
VPHPPHSPDLAPSGFWLFGYVSTSLVGKTFHALEGFLEAVTEVLEEIQPLELEIVFSHWIERVRWVLENNGDLYYN